MKFTMVVDTTEVSKTLENLSFYQMLVEVNQFLASCGYVDGRMMILDAEMGNVISMFHDTSATNFERLVFNSDKKYTISELIELPNHHVSNLGNPIDQENIK